MTPFAGKNIVTSPTGWRTINGEEQMHMGQDIITEGPKYTEPWMVRETTGGVVVEASEGYNYGRGKLVRVQYPSGHVACYQHLARIDVSVGEPVGKGHRLGLAGNTGDSYGEHLHFEVRTAPGEGGNFVDPSPWSGVPDAVGSYPGNDNTPDEVSQAELQQAYTDRANAETRRSNAVTARDTARQTRNANEATYKANLAKVKDAEERVRRTEPRLDDLAARAREALANVDKKMDAAFS